MQKMQSDATSFLCATVVGELYFGARNSARVVANLKKIDDFRANREILVADVECSQVFGIIKSTLEDKGERIPDNDIWIAVISMLHDLTVVMRDSHFKKVAGLKIVQW